MPINYALPKELYRQTVWFIKQYEQKRDEYATIAWSSPSSDGMPRGSSTGDPTQSKGLKAIKLASDLKAVEDALKKLPAYYREPVLDNIIFHTPWPPYAATLTYKRYKRMFVYHVAKNMGWI